MSQFLSADHRRAVMERCWKNDATQAYRVLLQSIIQPGMELLHVGCGWDKHHISLPYKETCKVTGIDLDPRVQPLFHSEFVLGSITDTPFSNDRFDVLFSEYVFEHLDDAGKTFSEMARILKSDGHIVILTPNLFSYKGLGACFTPMAFHHFMGRIRYGQGFEKDMYPTRYRCNTLGTFNRLAKQHNLVLESVEFVTNGPTWFQKFPLIFDLFHLYHLLLKRFDALRQLRCAMIVHLRKPSGVDNQTG